MMTIGVCVGAFAFEWQWARMSRPTLVRHATVGAVVGGQVDEEVHA